MDGIKAEYTTTTGHEFKELICCWTDVPIPAEDKFPTIIYAFAVGHTEKPATWTNHLLRSVAVGGSAFAATLRARGIFGLVTPDFRGFENWIVSDDPRVDAKISVTDFQPDFHFNEATVVSFVENKINSPDVHGIFVVRDLLFGVWFHNGRLFAINPNCEQQEDGKTLLLEFTEAKQLFDYMQTYYAKLASAPDVFALLVTTTA